MSSHFKFSAIFQTGLAKAPPAKVVSDPVKIEFFNGPRVLDVPIQMSRVMVQGQQAPIAQSAKLSLTNGPFISITVRTDESDPYKAKQFCEDHLDATITNLSIVCDPGLFSHQVYRGWLLEEKKAIMEAWIQVKPALPMPNDLAETLSGMSEALINNPELGERFTLMSRFLAKELLVPPSEEKFLYLWTILEIFPMKDTTDIKPISSYLSQLMSKDPGLIKERLGIGKLFGARSNLVHNGRLDIPIQEFGATLGRLETICLEVLRSMCGLPYSGALDKYFEAAPSNSSLNTDAPTSGAPVS